MLSAVFISRGVEALRSPKPAAESTQSTLDGLMSARAYIRTEIRDRMGVRHVPEITFAIDRSEKLGARMDHLLDRIGMFTDLRRVAVGVGVGVGEVVMQDVTRIVIGIGTINDLGCPTEMGNINV